ncbi:tryptophan-rich sensory protein [Carnobacterium funditum]|uniref:tryptophan-rich sensory protein n=1 Tax=Carnobacterium funditum TaxID=2752 RepID=UPI00054FB1A1|nr:tryptophan-rich sensory protein [Carnobacterium funditum]
MKTALKAWINILVFTILLVINYASSVGLINNITQKEMSDKYLTPITPASFTFSIWGVIYTLIFISLILMILNRNKRSYRTISDTISPLFWVSSLFNIGWVVLFLYDQILISTIFILAFTVVLTFINRIIVRNNDNKKNILAFTFGLYNGWLLIATIVNIAAYLVKINWNRGGLSQEILGIVLLSMAFIIAVGMMAWLKNAVFTLPAAWACYGIYHFLVSSTGSNSDYSLLPIVSIIYMIFLISGAIIQFKLNKWKLIPAPKRNIYL